MSRRTQLLLSGVARVIGTRQFNNQLNDCLERMARGEGLEQCAARYPDIKEELLSLLRVAAATMHATATTTSRPEAKARGLARLNHALAEGGVPQKRGWLHWPALPKPAVAGLAAVMVTSAAVVGAGAASANSVPGEPLYRVKTIKEDISMMMPKSEVEKARQHFSLAKERGREVSVLVDRGKMDMADEYVVVVTWHLNQSAVLLGVRMSMTPMEMPSRPVKPRFAEYAPELIQRLEQDGLIMRALFNSRLRSLPPDEQDRVRALMHRWELSYRGLMAALEAGPPQGWPFWMTERAGPVGR